MLRFLSDFYLTFKPIYRPNIEKIAKNFPMLVLNSKQEKAVDDDDANFTYLLKKSFYNKKIGI